MTTENKPQTAPVQRTGGRYAGLIKPEFDTVSRAYCGKRLMVKILDYEVAGYVDGTQVYGVYFDRGEKGLRSSMAKAPSGKMKDSFADIICMKMVVEVIYKMIPPNVEFAGGRQAVQHNERLASNLEKEK